MKIFMSLYLLIFMILLTVSSFADKSPEEIRNQVQVLIEESRGSSDWIYIGQTERGFVGFLSKDRFKVEGNKRKAWTKVFLKNGMKVRNNKDEEKMLIYTLTHSIYDCSSDKVSDIKTVEYFSDGTNDSRNYLSFYKVYPEKRWTDIIPGSVGDILLKFICSYSPS